ncbi:type II toxin-antitoxin system RelE/ParE family toxin [Dysgonomonas sp. 25]|uniref:type II toxin-antitoxin system RelE/ParE family toxin n=1 Tax=Dysgonomonas sp. 25 TaxID=2302933 RepID=UPI0013D79CD5|nr:type II toxin-antitoxin system RelE/ParE family toxin [Dysgonomonas sp. 25]NDV69407.1 type II toxin-antitoxin system RelE/ParE family toxin [Dysgonomonas sp. 25]
MRIIWLPLAQEDLSKIYNFIADKSEISAINVSNDILEAVELLKKFPQIAPIEPILSDYPETFRSLIVRTYKVIYFAHEKTVFITSIWDCRQDPEKLKNTIGKK